VGVLEYHASEELSETEPTGGGFGYVWMGRHAVWLHVRSI
jgi:hypothetical protein